MPTHSGNSFASKYQRFLGKMFKRHKYAKKFKTSYFNKLLELEKHLYY